MAQDFLCIPLHSTDFPQLRMYALFAFCNSVSSLVWCFASVFVDLFQNDSVRLLYSEEQVIQCGSTQRNERYRIHEQVFIFQLELDGGPNGADPSRVPQLVLSTE